MTNQEQKLHGRLNLRAKMHESLIYAGVSRYGANSASIKSPYFKTNIALRVQSLLKVTY